LSYGATSTFLPADRVLGDGRADPDDRHDLVRDANRLSGFAGYGLTSGVELSLGLHGSYENVAAGDRDALFPDATGEGGQNHRTKAGDDEASDSWRGSLRQTALSEASLAVKVRLMEHRGLRLGLMPFLESGAGTGATYAVTRSVAPKAGFLALASYGARGVAELNLNVGYRYRDPETIGELTYRNELIYRASVKAYATPTFAFFVAGDGRRINVAESSKSAPDGEGPVYRPRQAGAVQGGITATLGDAELAAFGGRGVGGDAFGFGRESYGVSLAIAVGGAAAHAPGLMIGDERPAARGASGEDEAKLVGPPRRLKPKDDPAYQEMIGAVDPLDSLEADQDGDFKDLPKRLEENAKADTAESPDARVERELSELRAAEEKQEAEQAVRQKADEAAQRKVRVEKAKAEDALRREWEDEATKDAQKLPSISHDQMDWDGLGE
jgi:hypothetical protein